MNIIRDIGSLKTAGRRVCVAIGFFDGVHIGHQQIIRQTVTNAHQHETIALVVTFDRHPNATVAPKHVPPLIYSLPQKLRAIESLGADSLLLLHFDQAFSEQPASVFIRKLAHGLGQVQSLCVGANFLFGHKRAGNVDLLKQLGDELKFAVNAIASVALNGKAVSSTRIREAIQTGRLDAASQMLGRAYSLSGTIVRGDALGQQLGFPTANLDATGLALPPTGVYAVHATIPGQTYRAVVNIGYRPTLQHPAPPLRVEAHLLDFKGDLLGSELEVTFVEKLREEKQFASLAKLRDQISQDILEAQKRFQ